MYATLVGGNTTSSPCESLIERLCETANAHGFTPSDNILGVRSDQTRLDDWTLTQKGPADGTVDFFLAVTAPKVPGISPIPVKMPVSGPLFAVIVMESVFGVWREDRRDAFSEVQDDQAVVDAFADFLNSVKNGRLLIPSEGGAVP